MAPQIVKCHIQYLSTIVDVSMQFHCVCFHRFSFSIFFYTFFVMDGNLIVKVFYPTEKEFDDPISMLKKIEMDPQCQSVGLAKVSRYIYSLLISIYQI